MPVDVSSDGGEDTAVREELHRAHPQALVAVAGGWAVESGRVEGAEERLAVRQQHHADREPFLSGKGAVHVLGRRGTGGVVDAHDALPQEPPGGLDDVVRPTVGVAVGRHGSLVGVAERTLVEHAVERTRVGAAEGAAGRVRSTRRRAQGIEARR